MVRAGGLEPPQALRPYGFSYQLRLSPPRRPRRGELRVCGLDYPFTLRRPLDPRHRRLGAARLVSTPSRRPAEGSAIRAWLGIASEGFPEFGQFCFRDFPRSTQAVPQVRCVYRFRHARVTASLYRSGRPTGRAAITRSARCDGGGGSGQGHCASPIEQPNGPRRGKQAPRSFRRNRVGAEYGRHNDCHDC